MKHSKLVLPEFMNTHGSLFGGYLLKWVDEFAYISANLDLPNNRFVTIALDNVVFKHAIKTGQILIFDIQRKRLGKTSVDYAVYVLDSDKQEREQALFTTNITFVNINDAGKPTAISH